MDYKSRFKNLTEWGRRYQNTIFAAFILISVFFIGLGLGLLTKPNKTTPIIIDKNVKINLSAQQSEFLGNTGKSPNFSGGNFVASINGKNYYPKDCLSAKRIKEENMIWFNSSEEAEADGYIPAKNCP